MNPRFTFNGSITGNALADLMIGLPATFLQGNGQVAYDRMNSPRFMSRTTGESANR